MLDDTHPEARRVQLERLRQLAPEQRLAMVDELSAMTTFLSRESIRLQRPDATEQQVILCWIERVYGRALAEQLAPLAHRLGGASAP
jgi:hypothetical protein